ncbi:class I SAM-dependent DNA methyltransferase [Jonesiaceae bacterium BS-20]|uniref:site-specific DNA-methyltransferase (adenine-specific) n=1 Tax=Jonesiaceae bacterium BS-20 TaxID=3120821 RepID=A0AAU7DSY4_9MICO
MAQHAQVVSDAIIVGSEWISEHFFTSDGTKETFNAFVLERRKAWDADGKNGISTPLARLSARRAELERRITALYPSEEEGNVDVRAASEQVYADLIGVLGYTNAGLDVSENGPLIELSQAGQTGAAPVKLLKARPADSLEELLTKSTETAGGESAEAQTLFEPYAPTEEDKPVASVSGLLSKLFVAEDGPNYVLVFSGRWVLLAQKERWAEGRYLAIDLQLVLERNDDRRGKELDRALTCITAQSVAPQVDNSVWWDEVLDASIKHTVGVSQDLRDGVRTSIEIIGNEVVARRREQVLAPLPPEQAQELAKQALRYLYRILFLLYAESSPELGVLPINTPEYEAGYSLDRLREMCFTPMNSPKTQHGTHLYESLNVLFELVGGMRGADVSAPDSTSDGEDSLSFTDDEGSSYAQELVFNDLRADLFLPSATALIDEVGLGNLQMQKVLEQLLLSKKAKGKDRGYISYAELGINQLGAVYEGLMSYTGFFAEDDLYEVAKDGDSSKGSWVVPVERSVGIAAKDFVQEVNTESGEKSPVIHERGSFVFRLAGRERQQSASYYTPEVLTRFTVGQALEELLDQNGEKTTAAEILNLTICEPALGSGAFAIEATRQLAAEYLKRRQEELGTRIEPDQHAIELQKVKAYIALHQVYGVDLNGTAVELAEISLWLDTMVSGLVAPWFGLHLRRGNSLIGARRAIFNQTQVDKKAHLKQTPTDIPMSVLAQEMNEGKVGSTTSGKIFHFLLPHEGWGAAADSKEAKSLAPDEAKDLRTWRNSIKNKLDKSLVKELISLSHRVESLWQLTLRRLQIAEQEIRRDVDVWGLDAPASGGAVERKQIEESLQNPHGAYQRLRRVMDAWNALWFWPLIGTGGVQPPTLEEWIDGLKGILGVHSEYKARGTRDTGVVESFARIGSWEELGEAEEWDLQFAGVQRISVLKEKYPWLAITEDIAKTQGFFHWELDFATVFANGGFDLQVGNPPWVRPYSDVEGLLAEGDPWFQLKNKATQAEVAQKREAVLEQVGLRELVVNGTADVGVTATFVGATSTYPELSGLAPDLYRAFMLQTWRNSSAGGIVSLLHPETHFTDEKAGPLRCATYPRLRRHWQFINELSLFEIHHLVSYGVHVYGVAQKVEFLNASNLYHPETVVRSFQHDGLGPEPGVKNDLGKWDQSSHAHRISKVTVDTLDVWNRVLGRTGESILSTPMVYSVNTSVEHALEVLSVNPRVSALKPEFSAGWNETIDRQKGYFDVAWGQPEAWKETILQGPNFHVGLPFFKQPNKGMKNNLDWSEVDLETLAPEASPYTSYKPVPSKQDYDSAYTHWGENGEIPARDHYRIAWRAMAANTGERTLISTIIPPGTAHIHGVASVGIPNQTAETLFCLAAFSQSLSLDFSVRAAPKSGIHASTFGRLPFVQDHPLSSELALRAARLNCLTDAYSDLWNDAFDPAWQAMTWAPHRDYNGKVSLGDIEPAWSAATPLRNATARRQALVEIDALVALMLGLSADELCTVYRTQFAVLYGYEKKNLYDANGRQVPNSIAGEYRKKGESLTSEERTFPKTELDCDAAEELTGHRPSRYTYEFPFETNDREADMRAAYAFFEDKLKTMETAR